MFCNEIGWHDLQIRQVSGKLADCAVQFANWVASLPIANWPDWQFGRNIDALIFCWILEGNTTLPYYFESYPFSLKRNGHTNFVLYI